MTRGKLNDMWMLCIQASTVVTERVGHSQQWDSVVAAHDLRQSSRACSCLALCQVTLESHVR